MTDPSDDSDARLKKAYEDFKSAIAELTETQRKNFVEKTNEWEKGLKSELANQMEQLTVKINTQLKKD